MNRVVSMDEIVPIIKEQLKTDGEVRFTPKGISMMPLLRSGVDVVTLGKVTFPLKKYDIALYQRDTGEYVLHRVIKVKDGTYTMRGDNQALAEPGIREDQIIGVVTKFTHQGKTYTPDNFNYKVYERMRVYGAKPHMSYLKMRRYLGKIKRKVLKQG